jgi:hypothetical protein
VRRIPRRRIAAGIISVVLAVGTIGFLAPSASADILNVDGGASGVTASVNLGLVNVTVPPTPAVSLPPGGGNETDSLANVNVPPVIQTGVLNVGTQGTTGPGGSAASTASVADPNVLDETVTADVIRSECLSDEGGSTGSSTLLDAEILGNPAVDLSPPPNTVLGIPGLVSIILNGQSGSTTADSTQITVRALEVQLLQALNVGNVVVSESSCGAQIGPAGGGPGGPGDGGPGGPGGPGDGGPGGPGDGIGDGLGDGGPGGVRRVALVSVPARAVTGVPQLTG